MYDFCLHCDEEAISIECVNKHIDKAFGFINEFDFPIKVCDISHIQFCHYCDKVIGVIEKYKKEFRPSNQKTIVDGICINPKQRYFFDSLANDLRPELENSDWYGRPFIVSDHYSDRREDYDSYISRMSEYKPLPSRNEWEKKEKEGKKSFYKSFPDGTRYFAQCYNGGAWDRSSILGIFSNLSDAIACCKGECHE
jgi:hypothetical protein